MKFKTRGFRGSNALWNYVVVNASLRSHIIHYDQSAIYFPKKQIGERERERRVNPSKDRA
jgi:hypothetical protein